MDELKSAIDKNKVAALIIFNTKKKAIEFLKCFADSDSIYHLSTSMCPAHRKKTINEIREKLANHERIIVCSTQLIEAGVDFDFPIVFREIAPLESLIQAAGRCNREGKLAQGDVFIFQPEDRTMPDKTYEACAGYTKQLIIDNPEKLHEPAFYESYYATVIKLFTDPDKYRINEARKNLHFSTVNDSYKLIKDATIPLFIYRYDEESRSLFNSISAKEFPNRDDYRKMQQYTVQVFPSSKIFRENRDLIETTAQGISLWHGGYDIKTGISSELPDPDILIL
jgi:CRISPR-associated endonuclease/helicase Cas3